MECDLQVKLGHLMIGYDTVIHNSVRLIRASKVLSMPLISTKMVNFGPIDPKITSEYHENVKVFEKSLFTMMEAPVMEHLKSLNKNHVILYGAETHICIKQTAIDLINAGFQVTVVVDAITSMNHHDRLVGIQALIQIGANITTVQSLVFELLRSSKHPKFKSMLSVIKDAPKITAEQLFMPSAKL
mmetsp:Transcript_5883/g.4193  ORF Transcript_5883/g.4193 Transcript_5883/m.4193 type:complete len:186 (+) Transcript_5883:45-602(+)